MGKLFARVTYLPTLAFNVVMEKISSRRWFDRIDGRVILGALPFQSMTKQLIEDENVCGVVSLNEDYELLFANSEKEWSSVGVKFLQLSTTDIFEAPSQKKLQQGVQFITSFDAGNGMADAGKFDSISNNEGAGDGTVYVHCKAGRTRSATLVACYLMQKYNYSPIQAVSLIRQKRPHILLGEAQNEAINTFFKYINKEKVDIHSKIRETEDMYITNSGSTQ